MSAVAARLQSTSSQHTIGVKRAVTVASLGIPTSGVFQQDHTQPALMPCVYIDIHCERCSDVRQALSCLPQEEIATCPRCGTSSRYSILGIGLTRRALPFYEVHRAESIRIILGDFPEPG